MKTLSIIFITTLTFIGCRTAIKSDGQNTKDDGIDTIELMTATEKFILKKLEGQHVRKTKTWKDGSWVIEFFEDTTDIDLNDIIWEYYSIDKKSIITGDLNNDDNMDFAIKTIGGASMGNMYYIDWHIFLKSNDNWTRIENDFGGGKFSDMETVTKVENGVLKTEFQELDEETMWLKDSIQNRKYELDKITLVRKK
ncbi:MAG: hypothetical protein JXQ87_17925 [Bacteroidia bacterium]